MNRPLFHLVEAGGWPASGLYQPDSLASQGFVHLSYAEQVEDSANRFYADAAALDVVEIDPLTEDYLAGMRAIAGAIADATR